MRLLGSLLVVAVTAFAAEPASYRVLSKDAGAWPQVLESIGLQVGTPESASILVARAGAAASADLTARVSHGAMLVLEGESPLAESFGFRRGKDRFRVTSIRDIHCPDLPIVWEKELDLPAMELPTGSTIFAKERWKGLPVTAGIRRGAGAVLWVAAPLGEHGYERFPYVLESLADLGMEPPLRSSRLWAFFDSSYRSRVDLDYFAARWRKAGISALQVAAWHFYESDPESDAYLRKLIEACHREGILVYAWLELPHVSEKFWDDHPEWREKTAVLQDAHLDWRKLMNLENRDCFRAASSGVRNLVTRFGWDGVNLAELYFESLEGTGNPARFTPMNPDIRDRFKREHGFDPIEIFGGRRDAQSRRVFLDFRSQIARDMQQEWMAELESLREEKPDLDLVLTHVDDRFDSGMRDAIGADAAKVLPMLDSHPFTFLIEDPATVWNLGAQRYRTIAERYQPLTSHTDRLAIDLNIVDRYQDVYPTKQQTGTELFQLVHSAAASFERVALYFENSLLNPDLRLLPAAAAMGKAQQVGSKTVVDSERGVGLPWKGTAAVDGKPWPVCDGETVWLPKGSHTAEVGGTAVPVRLLRLNGELRSAAVRTNGLEFVYSSTSRAIAILDRKAVQVEVDGVRIVPDVAGPLTILLPRGQHSVTISVE